MLISTTDKISTASVTRPLSHVGMDYTHFFSTLNSEVRPRTYFEIGTNIGGSLRRFTCDALCVDPSMQFEQYPGHDVVGSRKRLFLFQMGSDDFFRDHKIGHFLPGGPDIAFLDGMHLFEFLLRDFINTERECHERSMIILHDCLPLNARMAERTFRIDPEEDEATRGFWTGDVWRLLPILKRYRPDLRIMALNCPPTGLLVCSHLDPSSRVLHENYHAILDEYRRTDLASFGLERLWSETEIIDTRSFSEPPYDFTALFNAA